MISSDFGDYVFSDYYKSLKRLDKERLIFKEKDKENLQHHNTKPKHIVHLHNPPKIKQVKKEDDENSTEYKEKKEMKKRKIQTFIDKLSRTDEQIRNDRLNYLKVLLNMKPSIYKIYPEYDQLKNEKIREVLERKNMSVDFCKYNPNFDSILAHVPCVKMYKPEPKNPRILHNIKKSYSQRNLRNVKKDLKDMNGLEEFMIPTETEKGVEFGKLEDVRESNLKSLRKLEDKILKIKEQKLNEEELYNEKLVNRYFNQTKTSVDKTEPKKKNVAFGNTINQRKIFRHNPQVSEHHPNYDFIKEDYNKCCK